MALARSAALTAQAFVGGNLATARSLALDPLLRDPPSYAALKDFVERLLPENPDWEGCGLSDADGWNITSTGAKPRTLNVGDRPYFREVLATGSPKVSPAVLNRRTGNPTVILAVPVEFTAGGRGVGRPVSRE